jgi:hypothetical protein
MAFQINVFFPNWKFSTFSRTCFTPRKALGDTSTQIQTVSPSYLSLSHTHTHKLTPSSIHTSAHFHILTHTHTHTQDQLLKTVRLMSNEQMQILFHLLLETSHAHNFDYKGFPMQYNLKEL